MRAFAAVRIWEMKSSAAGLSVRFLSVTIAIGRGSAGSLAGPLFSAALLVSGHSATEDVARHVADRACLRSLRGACFGDRADKVSLPRGCKRNLTYTLFFSRDPRRILFAFSSHSRANHL
jgi:hypothetical protein